ncbi:MAG: DUF2066 domain-containing protein [Terricaulis sp.]
MKATPSALFAAILMAALCAFSQTPASAQGRDNIFAVAGVQVDETAANGAAAQQQGFASAGRIGFERLARRLTSADEQSRLALPQPQGVALERLVQSVDVEQERRSASRYIGRLTVRFDANQVRTLLRGAGFNVMETRTSPTLIVPVASTDASPETAALWRAVWQEGGYGQELVPLAIAPDALGGAPSWDAASGYARAEAAGSALYATLRVSGSSASAALVEVGPTGAPRDRGTVTAAIGSGDTGLRSALQSLADQASNRLQNEWKARGASGQGQRNRVSASALYSDERQWERIKSALEGAASTLISGIRIEAVGREGALVSFSFVGDINALGAELNRRGVSLEQTAQGPVLRVTGR